MAQGTSQSLSRGRLFFAAFVFAGFAALGAFEDQVLAALNSPLLNDSREAVDRGVQIGIWLSGAALFCQLLNEIFWNRVVSRATGRAVPRLLKDFLAFGVFLVALAGIIGIVFKQSLVGLWATSGAVSVMLGIALRSMISDIFTGLALNLDGSFKVGDWVEFRHRDNGDRVLGKVRDISWRTTSVELENHSTAVIPNSMIGTVGITNHSSPDSICRHELTVTLDFAVSAKRAMRVLQAAAKTVSGANGIVDRPEPYVLIKELSDLGTSYLVRYFVDLQRVSPARARHYVHRAILEHLYQAGLTPAYPKQDQFSAPMPVRHLDLHSETDRIEILRKIDLFRRSLSGDELRLLANAAQRNTYPMGSPLIRQGGQDHSMFILAEGLLEVRVSAEGRQEMKVAQLVPGEFFGEMALLTGEPRSATIIALTDTVAFEITKAHMQALLESRPEIAETLSLLIAERRLATSNMLISADAEERDVATRSLSAEILHKIKRFFHGVFGQAEILHAV